MRKFAAFLLFLLALIAVIVVATVAGWLAMPVAASITERPILFHLLTLIVVALVVLAGTYISGKLLRQKQSSIVASAGVATALLVFFGWQWLFRPAHELLGIQPPEKTADIPADHWDLPTGSRIAYRHFPASQITKDVVIWLHGGPGAYAVGMDSLHGVPRALADAGYEVYLYDQIGSGLSGRLKDPRNYTLERHIEDLSAIQSLTGARQVILIGSSWGSTLATHYIARHPDRVSAAIFNAPGEITPATNEGATHDREDSDRQAKESDQLAIGPRFLLMREIRLRNPALFERLSSDAEWDAVMDYDMNRFELKRGFCNEDPGTFSVNGFGLFAHNYTYLDFQKNSTDPRAELQQNPLPVLLMRGECEFLDESIVAQYRDSFQGLQYAEISDAGHFITIEAPEAFISRATQFLTGPTQ